jgi:hypothetical protein
LNPDFTEDNEDDDNEDDDKDEDEDEDEDEEEEDEDGEEDGGGDTGIGFKMGISPGVAPSSFSSSSSSSFSLDGTKSSSSSARRFFYLVADDIHLVLHSHKKQQSICTLAFGFAFGFARGFFFFETTSVGIESTRTQSPRIEAVHKPKSSDSSSEKISSSAYDTTFLFRFDRPPSWAATQAIRGCLARCNNWRRCNRNTNGNSINNTKQSPEAILEAAMLRNRGKSKKSLVLTSNPILVYRLSLLHFFTSLQFIRLKISSSFCVRFFNVCIRLVSLVESLTPAS